MKNTFNFKLGDYVVGWHYTSKGKRVEYRGKIVQFLFEGEGIQIEYEPNKTYLADVENVAFAEGDTTNQ
jgi:hypothetical protein